MALRIEHISFETFRSYEAFKLSDIGQLTVLVGPNAIGKTNVIEGVQLLTALTSFRNATIEQLVHHGSEHARLSMHVSDGNRELDVDCVLENHAKKYRLNGKSKRPAELKGLVPSVTFTPDDLDLVKGSMNARRHAVDVLGSQLTSNYYLIRKDYEKVVRHKNRLLKDNASVALLESINEMLITCGAQLTCYRLALFNRLVRNMKSMYEEISAGRELFSSEYLVSWESAARMFEFDGEGGGELDRESAREALAAALAEKQQEEIYSKRCLVGPHLDQIRFHINGFDASLYGSQGQQRSVVLAEKLAEAAVIEEVLGQKPVLLLDDVMSELDGARREALVSYISNDVQTFVTTANLAYFDAGMLSRSDVIELPMEDLV